ncbi:sensor histidine kinase [Novosphingobium mangrovi (ex Huang et al. 2023)]|uniref:histidine kinase n=1 Tax=Novosphingobium mangrovi (ex Huang et al. 2023) TaxID=2976432 RepID=A0ABT2I909_9SPHN|nr:HAMP domain-containing sensor histidine kinase [Novosphingobium mangrovi (ex Huang et al. 2023)]MCT2401022.1 HAMP domain-containing histidine kinase [Novosphingobium mangrovi (ex Huang et al. 2023)]
MTFRGADENEGLPGPETNPGHSTRGASILSHPHTPRFVAYVAVVFVALVAVQLTASLLFYQAIDRKTLKDDHARRIAELLVVSDRLHAITPEQLSDAMSTRYLHADVTSVPAIAPGAMNGDLEEIARQIVLWEPSLAGRSLSLARVTGQNGGEDLVGSIWLGEGNWLNFRSIDIASMWPIASRAIVTTFVTSVVLLAIGLRMLLLLARPLRRLTAAADLIGHGREVAIREEGPRDLRDLAHAMNLMQGRIARLLRDQTKSFEAISHDLRTPLARQKVAAELVEDEELSKLLLANVDEMEALLASLQQFLRVQHMVATPETVDLLPFIHGVVAPFADRVEIRARSSPEIRTYPEPLALAIAAVTQNAVQYGTHASVDIEPDENGQWAIVIEDDGPGIPPEYYEDILDPFFRLDEARARNTAGFGLGIPMAHRLMTHFHGAIAFAPSRSGGLSARLRIPVPDA